MGPVAERLSEQLAGLVPPTETRPLAGVEHEYSVWRRGELVDFRTIVHRIGLPGLRLHPARADVYRCESGLELGADGNVAEVATPPVAIRSGFGAELDAWARAGAEELRRLVPTTLRLQGESTHLSVALDLAESERVSRLYATTFAPALMLLLDRATSPGLLVRPRPGRTELCGEFAEGRALQVAAVFAAGSVRACALGHAPPHLDVVVEPARRRYGWYVDRAAFGTDLYAGGRDALLRRRDGGRVTAQEHLRACWERSRDALRGSASGEELALVARAVDGLDPLPCEAVDASPGLPVRPPAPPSLRPRERPGFSVSIALATWDFTAYRVAGAGRGAVVCVPQPRLPAFLEALDGGRLDGVLLAYLRLRPQGRVLASHAQTTETGIYDTVEPSDALLPRDRVGVGGGTRKVVPPPPAERGGTPWWWWAGGFLVVVLAAGGIFLATQGGDGAETTVAETTTERQTTTEPPPAIPPEWQTGTGLVAATGAVPVSDPAEDFIYSVPGVEPQNPSADVDIREASAGTLELTAEQAAALDGAYACGGEAVCGASAQPLGSGTLVVGSMTLAAPPASDGSASIHTYDLVFDSDGLAANDFRFNPPFEWDFFQGTDRWYHLVRRDDAWIVELSVFDGRQATPDETGARVVVDGTTVVWLIPGSELDPAAARWRASAFRHDGNFTPDESAGDVLGANPTEPLHPLQ